MVKDEKGVLFNAWAFSGSWLAVSKSMIDTTV